MEQEVEIKEGRGFATIPKGGILTFEIQGVSEMESLVQKEYQTVYSRYITDNMTMRVDDFEVPLWGEGHNLFPQEVYSVTSENKLLPEVINKQVKFLFGKGPRLYIEKVQGGGEKAHRVRIPIEDAEIDEALERWEEYGYDHPWEYLKSVITDFYYVKTYASKYVFSRARRLPGKKQLPIAALSYVGSDEARLATQNKSLTKRIKNSDCRFVIIADWLNPNRYDYEVYHRLDLTDPFRYPTALTFHVDKTFSKWIYAYTDWFKGLFEWIKASNLSPRYINSYLKNALNAHIHVIIPGTWVRAQKETLQSICSSNLTGDAPVQLEYKGVKLVDEKGKPIPFYDTMVEEVIANELRLITSLMSGEGKNQGKLYATTKWGEDGWQFEEMPGKFKEFIESVITYDKRSDQVILAGKGISSSITNVENDGVISKSGSDVYYNYLIYVTSLCWDEYFVMKDFNNYLRLNWPEKWKKGYRFGLWIDIPAKLQDTPPDDRLNNTATAETKTNLKKTEEQ